MKNSHIEWTDHTFNPWEGCTKVSPGCAHCYAEARNKRWAGGANWGPGAPRRRTSASNWKQPLRWNESYVCSNCGKTEVYGSDDCRHCGESALRRQRVFCASLADWLDDEVPIEWLADLLDLIRRTPHLDWLLLTKRPEKWDKRVGAACSWMSPLGPYAETKKWLFRWLGGLERENHEVPGNVWIGTTVEDQQRADERIPALLKIPAMVRFLSCEPLLGPVDLLIDGECSIWQCPECGSANVDPDHVSEDGKFWTCPDCKQSDEGEADWKPAIHWVICGGESGPGARPMHPEWALSLRDQCKAAGVPFFFKQWGEWIARSQYLYVGNDAFFDQVLKGRKVRSAVMRRDGRIDETLGEASQSNDDASAIYCAGKKVTGRLLDGQEHSEFPKTT